MGSHPQGTGNENQLALKAAIMELTNWVEQRGSVEVADNVCGALVAIDRSASQAARKSKSEIMAQ